MKAIGMALLIVWSSALMVSANEPSLGDRRLFFSVQERQAMTDADEKFGPDSATPGVSGENRAAESAASTLVVSPSTRRASKNTPNQRSTLIINGFFETSGYLTLFVNGKPCQRLSLTLKIPQKISCGQLAEKLLPIISLERIDKYHLVVKGSDGYVVTMDRIVE